MVAKIKKYNYTALLSKVLRENCEYLQYLWKYCKYSQYYITNKKLLHPALVSASFFRWLKPRHMGPGPGSYVCGTVLSKWKLSLWFWSLYACICYVYVVVCCQGGTRQTAGQKHPGSTVWPCTSQQPWLIYQWADQFHQDTQEVGAGVQQTTGRNCSTVNTVVLQLMPGSQCL